MYCMASQSGKKHLARLELPEAVDCLTKSTTAMLTVSELESQIAMCGQNMRETTCMYVPVCAYMCVCMCIWGVWVCVFMCRKVHAHAFMHMYFSKHALHAFQLL